MNGFCKDKNKKKYKFKMDTTDKRSNKGIKGGKIIYLKIMDGDKVICYYDEEWVKEPSDDISKYLFDIFYRRYN